MSKQTLPSLDPIFDFLRRVAEIGDWKYQDEKKRSVEGFARKGDGQGGFAAQATKYIKSRRFHLTLGLSLIAHKSSPKFLIGCFSIFGGSLLSDLDEYMPASEVLNHYGKRIARQEDAKSNDISGFWTISCARDLEALFRAYDAHARLFELPTVFNLP